MYRSQEDYHKLVYMREVQRQSINEVCKALKTSRHRVEILTQGPPNDSSMPPFFEKSYRTAWKERNVEKVRLSRQKYYLAKVKGKVRVNKAFIRDFVTKRKSDVPCKDCGGIFPPCAMDFDHLRDKRFEISKVASRELSISTIEKEMAKCDIVCSNCHRIRTYDRRMVVLNAKAASLGDDLA